MKKKGKKIWIVLAEVAAVAILGVFVLPMVFTKKTTVATYKTQTVKKGDFKVSIQGTGNIVSSNTKEVTVQREGEVQNLAVKEGDSVTEGQALFNLYSESLENTISDAEDNLKQQQISASKLQDSLANYKYYAPIDGYVYNLKAQVGDDSAEVASAYGYIAQIVPTDYLEIVCTPEYAPMNYNDRGLTINQKVWVVPRFDPYRTPVESRISGVDSTTYTVEVPATFGGVGTTVDVYYKDIPTVYYQIGEGVVQAMNPLKISGNGKVTKVHVTESQQVKKGDLMFEFDATDVQKSIQSSSITINSLKESLEENKDDFTNNAITAPISGVVTGLTAVEGGDVEFGDIVATIVDTDSQEMVISVDELDIPKVDVGQNVVITVDAITDKEYTGKVTEIALIGTVSNSITTYDVTITLDDTEGIRIGMGATAEIMVSEKTDAIAVPIDYVETYGTTKRVRIIPSGVNARDSSTWKNTDASGNLIPYEWREVTVGETNDTYTEILSGLEEGDVIAIVDTSASSISSMMMFGAPGVAGGGGGGDRQYGSGGGSQRSSSGGNQPARPAN